MWRDDVDCIMSQNIVHRWPFMKKMANIHVERKSRNSRSARRMLASQKGRYFLELLEYTFSHLFFFSTVKCHEISVHYN
jgi:hypothetical protein